MTKRKIYQVLLGAALALLLIAGALWLRHESTHSSQSALSHGHEHGSEEESTEEAKGPHGGRLFEMEGYQLEVSIFETGVEPQFRLYLLKDGEIQNPQDLKVILKLQRLGRPAQEVQFKPVGDFLLGDIVVAEPHSFGVSLKVNYGAKDYAFDYVQHEARTVMTAEQLRVNQVEIAQVGPHTLKPVQEFGGELRLAETAKTTLVPGYSGTVQRVLFQAGQSFKKGDLLAQIVSQDLAADRSAWQMARKKLEWSQKKLKAEEAMRLVEANAAQDLQSAQLAFEEAKIQEEHLRFKLKSLGASLESKNLAFLEVRASQAGTILRGDYHSGQGIQGDAPLFVVGDISALRAYVKVPASALAGIQVGDQAEVYSQDGKQSLAAQVERVGVVLDSLTRSAEVVLALPKTSAPWRVGMGVRVKIQSAAIPVGLAVPKNALQTMRGWNVVFGKSGDTLEARPLELGRSDQEWVEVLSGLQAGESYVKGNSFLIKADIEKSGASHDH